MSIPWILRGSFIATLPSRRRRIRERAPYHTRTEILSQPQVWQEALTVARGALPRVRTLWRQAQPAQLWFTGCGSSYHLGVAAAGVALWQGMVAHALPASELWLSPLPALGMLPRPLLIATSRSGETSETVRAVERFRRIGGQAVIAITCGPKSPLAESADVTLAIPAAREQSLAQTRSFASFLLLAQAVIDSLVGDGTFPDRLKGLPNLGRRLIEAHAATGAALGERLDLERFFFLGTGPCYGLANEGMLKLKEMSCTPSETYHALEFRHGPMTVIDGSTLVTALISDHARAEEAPLLREIRRLGTETLTFAEAGDGEPRDALDHPIVLHSGLPYLDRLVLYLPFLQLLGYHRSMAKGVDADRPRHLNAFVALESASRPSPEAAETR